MEHQAAVESLAVERYVLEEMSELERHEFEAHYFECVQCAQAVREAAAMAAGARHAGGQRSARIPLAGAAPTTGRRLMLVASLAAAAALAIISGYQAMITIPELKTASGPRVMEPFALAPASRGEPAVVPAAAAAQGVAFSLDVNAPSGTTRLAYQLSKSAGSVLLSGAAAAPLPGTPFVLWLPAGTLAPGDYQITLSDPSAGAREIGVYRFAVR
jgi:hypothetical protein